MAEEPVGLKIAEKFSGLFVLLIGVILFYVTYTSIEILGAYPVIFLVISAALIVLGVIMILAKAE